MTATTRLAILGDRRQFLTHDEIDATVALLRPDVQASWIATDSEAAADLSAVDAVWLAPGTPYRNEDAVFAAIEDCRISQRPLLGTCGGFQYAAVCLARSLARIDDAVHTETGARTGSPIVVRLACSLYGEIRTVQPKPRTRFAEICGDEPLDGFHYCGFGLNETFRAPLEEAGVVVSATAEDAGVEAIELPDHPFFIATAFQPQVGASETRTVHPLIAALCAAGRRHRRARTNGGID